MYSGIKRYAVEDLEHLDPIRPSIVSDKSESSFLVHRFNEKNFSRLSYRSEVSLLYPSRNISTLYPRAPDLIVPEIPFRLADPC